MVVMTVQDQAAHVARALLRKIHQARRFMTDIVEDYRKEAYKTITGQSERATITLHDPEYALAYLVHVLAHRPNYSVVSGGVQPESSAYEPFYRELLLFFLRALINQDVEGKFEPTAGGPSAQSFNLPAELHFLGRPPWTIRIGKSRKLQTNSKSL